jgi:hypothetical protein
VGEPAPARPRLSAVPDDATPTGEEPPPPPASASTDAAESSEEGGDDDGPPRPRRPSHLKLVK